MFEFGWESAVSVRLWGDPPGDGEVVPSRSAYVDQFWLPLLGPVATCTARLLACHLSQDPGPVTILMRDLATSLGVDARSSAPAVLVSAFQRLEEMQILANGPDGALLVRHGFPHLGPIELGRLPFALQEAHRTSFSDHGGVHATTDDNPVAPNARLLSLAATVDEILINPELSDRPLAYRWEHVARLAEEARDEALLSWAAPDLETALTDGQASGQTLREAMWSSQHAIASRGQLPATCRSQLSDAAAGVIDWMVSEFPLPPGNL